MNDYPTLAEIFLFLVREIKKRDGERIVWKKY